MGVTGLWPLLDSTGKPVDLSKLEGKRLVVDISLWLCQAESGYAAHGLNSKSPHLSLLLHRISKLLYYKVRPIFVFDGSDVPSFKRQLLRDRALKRHLDEIQLNKRQKQLLIKLAQSNLDKTSTSRQDEKPESDVEDDLPGDYMAGYEKLVTEDERISFLLEAKERARTDRLRADQIPTDFDEFSKFQLERLVNRNAITVELDKIKSEKAKEFTRIVAQGNETVVVGPYYEAHVLRKGESDDKTNIKADSDAKKQNWDKFLNKMKNEYDEEEDDCGTGGFNYMKLLKRFAKREEEFDGDEEEDVEYKEENEMDVNEGEGGENDDAGDKKSKEKVKTPLEEMEAETVTVFTPENSMDVDDVSESTSDSDTDFIDVIDLPEPKKAPVASTSFGGLLSRVNEANPTKNSVEKRKVTQKFDGTRKIGGLEDGFGKREGGTTSGGAKKDGAKNHCTDDRKGSASRKQKTSDGDIILDEDNKEHRAMTPEFESRDVLKRKLDDDDDWAPEDVLNSELGMERPKLVDLVDSEGRIDSGVYKDCQLLLTYLGLPYIVAPSEAEAQCVCLERLGLCDGIVTEDSDVWLFGGETVFKNMFGRKDAMEYSASKIFDEYGISRAEFIAIGMLAGGDYTKGFDGVGAVTALELCAEFDANSKKDDFYEQGLERLKKIGQWLKAKRQFEFEHPGELFKEKTTKIRLRRVIENNNDAEKLNEFPSVPVYEAYVRPNVDSNPSPFKWTPIDFDSLHTLIWTKLGWSESEVKKRTHSALEMWQTFVSQRIQHYQLRMDSFLRKPNQNLFNDRPMANTARVQKALDRLRGKKRRSKDSSDSDDPNRLQTLINRAKKSASNKKQPHFTATVFENMKSLEKPEVADDFYDDSVLEGFVFPTVDASTSQMTSEYGTTSKVSSGTATSSKSLASKTAKGGKASLLPKNVATKGRPKRAAKKVVPKVMPTYQGPNLSEDSDSD
ncbi:unnamed protein product [Bursaphelenchus okinawaensis]|uniref:XPGI domain-containing protein n=1 Tax=Bursaphelenchus okinawaensis TaxID=465554 RepID=A0A811LH23_9BILA|nr:unnamed protein product [Bursaphelenchus okinawaensis]CAG9123303.1 unnamed protein product [Bursaphelenchus okinawaensis]